MSVGVCQPARSTSVSEAIAQTIASTRARGHRDATAAATSTVRSVWPLGNDVSKATMWNEPS
jgi:hypothetical protein